MPNTIPWEQRKLGELATFSKGCGYSKSDLRDSGYPIILYGRLYTQYETEITEVDTFIENDINAIKSYGNEVIVPASGETSEEITRASAVGKKGIVIGGDLNIIRPKQGISTVFLALSISNGDLQKNLSKKAQGKSVVHIRNDDLKEVILKYPSYEEQTQIGNFFKQLDDTIALHQRTLEKYQKLKISYLEKMFPKENELYPELRFPNFTDAWEQRKLGECFNERTERSSIGELISVTMNSGVIKASDLDRKDNSSKDKSNYKKVEIGDIAYNSMRMWQGSSGESTFRGILSPAYTVLIPNKDISSTFFSYYFKLERMLEIFKVNSQGLTSDTWNLKYPTIAKIVVSVPTLKEQIQIGNFFKQLDDTIALHQREVKKYKKIKQSYLEKMFI